MGHWIQDKKVELDAHVPLARAGETCVYDMMSMLRNRMKPVMHEQLAAEIICSTVINILGRDATVLGIVLAGIMCQEPIVYHMLESPGDLLACMVRKLEEL